jgi:hypothetical protein
VRFLLLLPDDRLHFQISNFRFSHSPSPQALDSRLSTQSPYLRDTPTAGFRFNRLLLLKEHWWALSPPCKACHFVADFHSSSPIPSCACLSKSRHCIAKTAFFPLPQRANRLPPRPRSNITRIHARLFTLRACSNKGYSRGLVPRLRYSLCISAFLNFSGVSREMQEM